MVALSACARSAPDLPPDYGSVNPSTTLTADHFGVADLDLSCADIVVEREAMTTEAGNMTGAIRQNRHHNQVAGYLGGLFIFPLIATRGNSGEKQRLDQIQERWDTLTMLDRYKKCPPAVAPS